MNCPERVARRGIFAALWLAGGAGLLGLTAGCNVTEAVVDGFYGGISDTVAATISSLLLALLGAGVA